MYIDKPFSKKIVLNRIYVKKRVHSDWFRKFIALVIVFNAILIGRATFPNGSTTFGLSTDLLSDLCGWIYLTEISMRIYAHGFKSFFMKNPFGKGFWNWFDFLIVAASIIPSLISFWTLGSDTAVIRTLRLIRLFKFLTHNERARKVIGGFVMALPSMGTVIGFMIMILFMFGVITTNRFGETQPENFGTLWKAIYSLFQVMTLESWSSDFANPLSETFGLAKPFFVIFILMTTFAVLNLLVALIVNSMQDANNKADSRHVDLELEILKKLDHLEKLIGETGNRKS